MSNNFDHRPKIRERAGVAPMPDPRFPGSSPQAALDVLGESGLAAFAVLDGFRVTYASAAFLALIGSDSSAATPPASLLDFVSEMDAERVQAGLASPGRRHCDIYRLRRANGSEGYAAFDAAAIETVTGPRTVLVAADVTSWMRSLDRLQRLAFEDALTGLAIRPLLRDRLEQAIAAAKRSGDSFALLMIDLDRFKPINDVHGHATGDLVLREIARRLESATRAIDTVARLGGDEFVVLLGGDGGRDEAGLVTARIVAAVAEPLAVHGLRAGVSVGIAIFPDDGSDADQLLARADAAMYDAKHRGGNCYAFAQPAGAGNENYERLPWSPSYLIGADAIDVQHEHLVTTMNELCDALQAGRDRASLLSGLAHLTDLLEQHFAAEEAHMATHPFPGCAAHRADHEFALETARALAAQADVQSLALAIQHLHNWLLRHIRSYDTELPYRRDG